MEKKSPTFEELNLHTDLISIVHKLGWEIPTPIQCQAIPVALQGNDIVALAETGSGKTAAFCLPIVHRLLSGELLTLKSLILSPTRELAKQIHAVLVSICKHLENIQCTLITGGADLVEEAISLAQGPQFIIATPGRLVEHLDKNSSFRGLNLVSLLVLDEADMMLNLDFLPQIECILRVLKKERNTWLFSATMTSRVFKLSRSSVKSTAVRISVSDKFSHIKNLTSEIILVPDRCKDLYLVHLLVHQEATPNMVICFTETCSQAERLHLFFDQLDPSPRHKVWSLHGRMDAEERNRVLKEYSTCQTGGLLFATDVASRGLDIPSVDLVINYDLPRTAKEYIHRVGRTARANRAGNAITFVTKLDLMAYMEMEKSLTHKLPVKSLALNHAQIVQQCEAETIAASKAVTNRLNATRHPKRLKKE